uniref:TVP38/TMEM64 family membrane protein n=1 Tax=candidate division WOR-3 bacterium TaxID=2052148 RepID=A0A7V3UZG7_UNCW3
MRRKSGRILFLVLTGLVVIALTAGFILIFKKWDYVFQNPLKLRKLMQSWGIWAPLGTIGLQVIQIVFAPLPGNVAAFAAGYALGFWPTIIWLMLGVLAGASLTFLISRFFGRNLLQLFVPATVRERFDQKMLRQGTFYIFLLLLIPNPAGDWVYYLAGLTRMPLRLFLLLVLIARLPSNIIECGVGASAIRFGLREWLIFGIVVLGLTIGYFLNQRRIENLLMRIANFPSSRI